jgi:hypothetical protein
MISAMNGADSAHPCNINLDFAGLTEKNDSELSGIQAASLSAGGRQFLDASKLGVPVAVGVARTAIACVYVEYGQEYSDGTGHNYAEHDLKTSVLCSHWRIFENFTSALQSVPAERIARISKRINVAVSVALSQCAVLNETLGEETCKNKFS